MSNLERSLSQVLDEHRHESGLHVIGGEKRLLDRLVHFFEEELKMEEKPGKSNSKLEH
jgi:hypothetical protein